jgi:AraC family transcriptional regulator, arabinose operon regulatory protein
VPSEAANEPFFTQQARSYTDCYRWSLTEAERLQWVHTRSPALNALRVFSCGIFVEARGHWWERASLPEGVLIYCTEGEGHYRQGDREWAVQPGDLLYAPPRTHHRYWADEEHPWTIYWAHLSGDLLLDYERILGLIERGPVRHIGLHNEIVSDFTRLIIQHPTSTNEADWFCIQANAVTILGRIAGLPHNIAEIAAAYGPIQKAITLMTASLNQPFDMPRFAREAGCGSRHFIRQFQRVTGLTPGDWFIRQKMQRARALLSLPNIQVKEVAARLSYSDPLYFSRIFKQVVGSSPDAYRRKLAVEETRGM